MNPIKLTKIIIFALILSFVAAGVALAQNDLPDTAKDALNDLILGVPGFTAALVGIIGSVLTKLSPHLPFVPDDVKSGFRKAFLIFAGAVIPMVLEWGLVSLTGFADYLDSTGLWALLVAAGGTSFVWYRLEKFLKDLPPSLAAALAARG